MITVSLALCLPVWAVGSPSSDVPAARAGHDKRQKANVHFRQGETYTRQGRHDAASQAYEKAIALDSEYAEAYSNLGFSYRKQGRLDQAIDAYKRAIDLKPDLTQAHEYLGETYAEMKEFALAEQQLQILRSLNSEVAAELDEFIRKMRQSH